MAQVRLTLEQLYRGYMYRGAGLSPEQIKEICLHGGVPSDTLCKLREAAEMVKNIARRLAKEDSSRAEKIGAGYHMKGGSNGVVFQTSRKTRR